MRTRPAVEAPPGASFQISRVKARSEFSQTSLVDPAEALRAEVEARVEAALERLFSEARGLVGVYWVQCLHARRTRSRSEWSRLGVRARRLGPGGALLIEWYRVVWVRRAGRPLARSRYLAKGRGERYREATLARAAQPWQRGLVAELEDAFAELRRLARSLGRVRLQARLHAGLARRLAGEPATGTGEDGFP
jgi:hypothetical protein